MGKVVRHLELPAPSTDSITDASLLLFGRSVLVKYDYYRDESPHRAALCFKGVVSTKSRSERCCTSWHVKAFDVLLEIVESQWLVDQREDISPRYRDEFTARHFMIYFDSVGCFEVLADDFELIPEEVGSWKESRNVSLDMPTSSQIRNC